MKRLVRRDLIAGLLIAALGVLAGPGPARGAVILGNLAGNSFSSGYYVGGGGGLNNSIVQGFTMADNYRLTSVNLYLSNFSAGDGSPLRLSIYSNKILNGHNAPDVNLHDLSTNVTGTTTGTPTLATFTGSFLLEKGTTYWLDLYSYSLSDDNASDVLWNLAQSLSPSGVGATYAGQARSVGGGNPPTGTPSTTELRTAFQLNGDLAPVPEPAAFGLATLGGLTMLACQRIGNRPRSRAGQ